MPLAIRPDDLPHYTYHDYLHWEGAWELIQGIPYAMAPSPVKGHQRLALAIGAALLNCVEDCSDCDVLLDTDWLVRPDTVLKPDVALVCHDDAPNHISTPPVLIVEVLSPSTARRDEGIKRREYEEQGVMYYVMIDPDTGHVTIDHHRDGAFQRLIDVRTPRFEFTGLPCPVTLDFDRLWRR